MPTEDQIKFLQTKGLIWNAEKRVFQIFIVDKVCKEVTAELVRDVYQSGKIDSLIESIKHDIGHDIAGQLFEMKFII